MSEALHMYHRSCEGWEIGKKKSERICLNMSAGFTAICIELGRSGTGGKEEKDEEGVDELKCAASTVR
jgi:hypothetical protein